MEAETEIWTSDDQMRKPDLSFLTLAQARLAREDFEPIPEFVIEVISPNDKAEGIKNKVAEYFKVGVKIIWYIFPLKQTVEIYRSDQKAIETCTGSNLYSAEPVVESFNIKAEDIFRRP